MRIFWMPVIGLLLIAILSGCRQSGPHMDDQLGLAYLQQGDRPRAKQSLLRALENEPRSASVNAAMAYFLETTDDIKLAGVFYKKAIHYSKSAEIAAHWNNYGAFLCRKGDTAPAEIYFLKAAHYFKYTHTALAYENAGLCALAAGDQVKARTYFKQALMQDPLRKQAADALVHLEGQSTGVLTGTLVHRSNK